MNVLIFDCVKNSPVYDFYEGILKYGHKVKIKEFKNSFTEIDNYDVIVASGFFNGAQLIHKKCLERNKLFIGIEDSFIVRRDSMLNRPYSISKNGFAGYGYYIPINFVDSSRWDNLDIKILPWRKEGDHILICLEDKPQVCHNVNLDIDTVDGRSLDLWYKKTIFSILDLTNRKIIIRSHPRVKLDSVNNIYSRYENIIKGNRKRIAFEPGCSNNLDDHLNNCHILVSYESNTLIESVIKGVPILIGGKSVADTMGIHNVQNIEHPITLDREEWCNWLAWLQWRPSEMREGLPWKYLVEEWGNLK